MQAIGVIKSCFKDKFATPRQPGLTPGAIGEIHIEAKWQPIESLNGLSDFSHLWVVFLFHQNSNKTFLAKTAPPRLNGKKMGVFATRSPHRPNPIGLSLLKIEAVSENIITVSGMDVVDGTPVLDIKPYLHFSDCATTPVHGWVDQLESSLLDVKISPIAEKKIYQWETSLKKDKLAAGSLKQTIIDLLQQDPRPLAYKGADASPIRKDYYYARLYNGDLKFSISEDGNVELIDLRFGANLGHTDPQW